MKGNLKSMWKWRTYLKSLEMKDLLEKYVEMKDLLEKYLKMKGLLK